MSPRRQRIEKVIVHRGKELDKRVLELNQQKSREEAARAAAEGERKELQRASETRLKLTEARMVASSWIEANEWLKTRAAKAEIAETQAIRARAGTQRARAHVLNARSDLKKVEVLSTRIETEERSKRERAERRLEDEIAALLFNSDRRGDK
jgi:flagellar biosynthesis chaperone FliJ